MQYWLMKSEPTSYSIDTLKADTRTSWDGVRNYQARNFMRDKMQKGDKVLFYHSNTKEPAVTGVGKVCSESYPDLTQFDKKSKYYDAKATKERPIWYLVDICFVKKLKNPVTLTRIKAESELKGMALVQTGFSSFRPAGRGTGVHTRSFIR